MSAFLIRCAVWTLLAWGTWTWQPVHRHVVQSAAAWRQAWTVDAPAGYRGLLFRTTAMED